MKTILYIIGIIFMFVFGNCDNNNSHIQSKTMDSDIENRILKISKVFEPIKVHSLKYLKQGFILTEDSTICIYNQKWEAPLKYAIRIFNKTPEKYINDFEKINNIKIPELYVAFLKEMNGCFIYDFDLFGLIPSVYETGKLDRSFVQCFDLGTANINWIKEYNLAEPLFHFGSRAYSNDENIGYFMTNNGIIKSVRKNGEILSTWNSFPDFLTEELHKSELRMIEKLPEDEKKKL